MMRLKSCYKRKTVDTVLDRDAYGSYMRCLQCGLLRYLVHPIAFATPRDGTYSSGNTS